MGLAGISQQLPRPQQPQHELQQFRQRWQELNLTMEQKQRIIALIQRQRQQQELNRKALDQILTEEQKKKLLRWKEEKDKIKTDSTAKQ